MMRILFVLDKYGLFGTPNSGASNRNTLFVKALTKLGHVDVCSFSNEAIVSDIEDCDIVYSNTNYVFSEKGNKYIRGLLSLIQMTLSPLNPNAYYRPRREMECIIDELVRKNDYDIIACRYISTAIRCGLLKYYSKLVLDIDDNPANSIKTIATSMGINMNEETISLLQNSEYSGHIEAIAKLDQNDHWNKEMVEKRRDNLLDIIWDKVSQWLS